MTARLVAIAILALLLALPVMLRPVQLPAPAGAAKLVIITPHGEPIRAEFGRAFAAWAREHRGLAVDIDWRTPGGTSEISKILATRFAAVATGPGFDDPKSASPARIAFLASDVGVGIDLMFGGGEFPFRQLANKGFFVDAGLIADQPDWFRPEIIPQQLSGETIYDAKGRYYGACLTLFGIAWSPERHQFLGLPAPTGWSDLAGPGYLGQVTLTDPTRSGAAVTVLERILQQCLAESGGDLAAGWQSGLTRIRTIVANTRALTDSASKPVRDVVRGDAAAAMALDFQAKTEIDLSPGPDRLRFTVPAGGTSVSADPIALLRGAPHRVLAVDFIRFVLSPAGQRLWNYRPGTPGGPERWSLRRLPVRSDVLDADWQRYAADPDMDPRAIAATFTYRPAWTAALYPLIGPLVKATMLDVRDEWTAAWTAIIAAGGPTAVPAAWVAFQRPILAYGDAVAAKDRLGSRDAEVVVPLLRAWTEQALANAREARRLANPGTPDSRPAEQIAPHPRSSTSAGAESGVPGATP